MRACGARRSPRRRRRITTQPDPGEVAGGGQCQVSLESRLGRLDTALPVRKENCGPQEPQLLVKGLGQVEGSWAVGVHKTERGRHQRGCPQSQASWTQEGVAQESRAEEKEQCCPSGFPLNWKRLVSFFLSSPLVCLSLLLK